MSVIDKYLKDVRLSVLKLCGNVVFCQTQYNYEEKHVSFYVIYEDATQIELNINVSGMLLDKGLMELIIIKYFYEADLTKPNQNI